MKKILIVTFAAALFASCDTNSTNAPANTANASADTLTRTDESAANAVISASEFTGNYMGNSPCKDCKALNVFLALSRSNKCNYLEKRLGDAKDKGASIPGTWEINADTTRLDLKLGPKAEMKSFIVNDDGSLQPIDASGNPVTGDDKHDGILRKVEMKRIENETTSEQKAMPTSPDVAKKKLAPAKQ